MHRAEGSEAAQRLLNVALSRAQAKLVLFVSPADAASPLPAPLQRLRLAGDTREASRCWRWPASLAFQPTHWGRA